VLRGEHVAEANDLGGGGKHSRVGTTGIEDLLKSTTHD
jgi:hypothetical protein